MLILAVETSCDETATAVVKDGREILSNVISSQVEFHKKYGGIVPEVASRKHIEAINPIIQEALDTAGLTAKKIDAVAVTYGPGLVGCLLVGLCAAKALAYSLDVPLIGVNHLEAHIYANFLDPLCRTSPSYQEISSPSPLLRGRSGGGLGDGFISLLVSGGHTMLILVKGHGQYQVLGQTRDDAAGEAFDKVARFLNLGYPGGPVIDQLAKTGNPTAIDFKRPMLEKEFGYDFSFSGIKTAVVNYVKKEESRPIADLVASFQQAVVDVLVEKALRAAQEYHCNTIVLAGGVSANSKLREDLQTKAQALGLQTFIPPLSLCTDNAAMVGCAGYYALQQGKSSDLNLAPIANLKI